MPAIEITEVDAYPDPPLITCIELISPSLSLETLNVAPLTSKEGTFE